MEKTVLRGIDTLFYNSQCVFVEFHDVLAMPYVALLAFGKNRESFSKLFDMRQIEYCDLPGLIEWYVNRPYQNILKCLTYINEETSITDDMIDELLSNFMNHCPELYTIDTSLKFLSVLRLLVSDKGLVKRFVVYSEREESGIKVMLNHYFEEGKVQYLHGKFEDTIGLIPKDSTFVFSDIEKVQKLADMKRLSYSTVLIPAGLRYNKKKDDPEKLKVDFHELSKEHLFKYSFFDNFELNDVLKTENIPFSELKKQNTNLSDLENYGKSMKVDTPDE